MSETAGYELAADVAKRAKSAGFSVTTEQIARWSRDGLLPGSRQKGLGQRSGSEVRYPIGTGDQLVALCTFHKQFRKLEDVGWYLWLNRFPVADRYWRTRLVAAAAFFEKSRNFLRNKILNTTSGIVSLRRSGERLFKSLSTVRSGNRQFRRARRRVGADQIGKFCEILATIAVGAYRTGVEPNEQESVANRKVSERGFGLTRARTDLLENGRPLLTTPIEINLEELSYRIAKVSKAALLKSIQLPQMARARDELRLLLTGLQRTYINLEKEHGKHAFGLGVIADFATITDIKLQALMILLFETIIRPGSNQLREILDAIEAKRVNDVRQHESSP